MPHWHVCGVLLVVSFFNNRIPQPRFDPKKVAELQANLRITWYGQSFVGLIMMLWGLWFGDALHVMWFSSISIVTMLYASNLQRVPFEHLMRSTEVLLIVAAIGGQFVLPQGPASAMLFYALTTSMLALSETVKHGVALTAIGVCIYVLLPFAGVNYAVSSLVPEWVSFLTLLLYASLVLALLFSYARQTVSEAMEKLVETEQSIENEMAELSRRNLQIHEGNRALERGTLFLNDTLDSEAQSTNILAAKRDDQQRLTNAIHHDMREPLRGIVSFSQLIQRKLSKRPEADGVQEYLGYAVDGGQRMAKMLDDLLLYSKNNHTEIPQPHDLIDLLAEVQEDLHDLIDRTGAIIKVTDLPCVMGYETQLKQLFQNLLSNALKFRKEGSIPSVSFHPVCPQPDASKFSIEVRDNGVGIPENQLEKVFGLFNRAHEEQAYEGSGVGLALCRRIAISHAATLTVKSTLGEGTSFFISFPITGIVKRSTMSIEVLDTKEKA